MPLSIRDPRAADLARKLAERRGTTMTKVIISALEEALQQDRENRPLDERFMKRIAEFNARNPNVRPPLSKAEIDALWGE